VLFLKIFVDIRGVKMVHYGYTVPVKASKHVLTANKQIQMGVRNATKKS
jgi:hypothetical protein